MEIIVIKMGGVASDNLTPVFFEQVAQWQALGKKIVIVHGGGHYISEMLQKLSLPIQIKEGLRVTDAQTLEITRMAGTSPANDHDLFSASWISGNRLKCWL